MKVVVCVEARMGSSRLPGKVLKTILDKPMLQLMIERIRHSKQIDEIIVATTVNKKDDAIEKLCKKLNINVFRGNCEDVLDRYYKAAIEHHADIVVRITGDCPLIDPSVVDKAIHCFLDNDYDYVSNTLEPTYPDGLDVEVFSFKVLEIAWNESDLLSDREHVTPYIKNHPEKFKLHNMKYAKDFFYLRWTVDQKEDLDFVREIFDRLYSKKQLFFMEDILKLLKTYPELEKINAGIQRNEGYLSSLKKNKIIQKRKINE
jgi:spore coat polysaccharide biosynthesis protein SpsF (cytidylyltransferase family)